MIVREFSGRSEFAFCLAHDYLNNAAQAVGFCIHEALHGAGTDDLMLIHVTILFSDYFKGAAIQQAYMPFGDVRKEIKRDLTGKYEKGMLAMWGL